MMMALGLQLTAQPRCTLGCMIDGEREGGRKQTETQHRRKLQRLSKNGRGEEGRRRSRGKEGERGIMGRGCRETSVEGKPEQEIEISRYDRSGRDSSGQTEKVEGE